MFIGLQPMHGNKQQEEEGRGRPNLLFSVELANLSMQEQGREYSKRKDFVRDFVSFVKKMKKISAIETLAEATKLQIEAIVILDRGTPNERFYKLAAPYTAIAALPRLALRETGEDIYNALAKAERQLKTEKETA